MTAPLPSDSIAPVCPLQSLWVACEVSTRHLRHVILSAERLSFMCRVPLRYLRTRFSLPQSSSSGSLTRVVRKEIVFFVSPILFTEK